MKNFKTLIVRYLAERNQAPPKSRFQIKRFSQLFSQLDQFERQFYLGPF